MNNPACYSLLHKEHPKIRYYYKYETTTVPNCTSSNDSRYPAPGQCLRCHW